MTLTLRDFDILETLTRRVRILTVLQIARVWWPTAKSQCHCRRRINRLARAGLIEILNVCVHPLLPIGRPLFRWQPGAREPEAARLAIACQQRWDKPAVPLTVCVATPLSANVFGSTACGISPLEHRNHDLRLGDVYVAYRCERPALAATWIGEHAMSRAGYRIKDPDAFLCDADGSIGFVIESAGRYSSGQVQSFHDHCAEYDLPYELW